MAAIEAAVGRRFGDPNDPLLVSVRSGAPVSMPGMMDTILDLGLNDATTAGLARVSGDEAFASGVASGSRRASARSSASPTCRPIRGSSSASRSRRCSARGTATAPGPTAAKEGIPDDLGTAVTVQAMVFGNRGPTSATGVLFTRNPATGEPSLYGDVLFDAQGEDVVAGTHRTEPIAILDDRLPAAAADLRDYAGRLERHFADMCDIEFTIEDGRLWMLQVRVGKRSPQAALRIAVDMADDLAFPLSRAEAVERVRPLLAGATDGGQPPRIRRPTAGPRAARLAGDRERADRHRPRGGPGAADAGRAAILVRAETSPDDVHGMARAAGILTSRGGLASHAAVVARGWDIPAVVGARRDRRARRPGRHRRADAVGGGVITIDGTTGEVFEGAVPGATEVVPEAATLLAWARELGIADQRGAARRPAPAIPARAAGAHRLRCRPSARSPRTAASGRSRSRASLRSRASPTRSCRRRRTSNRSSSGSPRTASSRRSPGRTG